MFDILITTWPRYPERIEYLERNIISLKKHIKLGNLETGWYISTETHDAPCLEDLEKLTKKYDIKLLHHKNKPNLGANLNFAHKQITGNFILYIQDDFECIEDLDIRKDISFLKKNDDYEMIRYYWRSKTQPRIEFKDEYFELSKKCRNYYSDNPHLKSRHLYNTIGEYITINNSVCEHNMNSRIKKSNFKIALKRDPLNPEKSKTRFQHIGRKSSMTEKWYNHPTNVRKRKEAAEKAKHENN